MDSPDQPLKHTFSLHLPGLLKVLAEHLYSNRNVGVRELIQNAMDSCTRRQIQEQDGRYQPRVELDVDSEAGTLSIFDNGSGLNRDEIHQFLSTIGRGYTRVLREDLAFSAPEDADQLIGQFGLGFLSAFLLASRVEVVTRSTDGSGALRWSSAGDENYEVEDAQRESPGTTVVLHLKIQANYLLDQNVTSKIITKFADFLPTPIYWSGETTPLNRTQPPWLDQNPGHEIKMYINDRFGDQSSDPLLIVPLENWPVPAGKEQITVPITGFLFIPSNTVASIKEFGDLAVYIRRMFICDNERKLLPPWAKFVRGVIECPMLQPTASREDLHQDESFEFVRKAIEQQLLHALADVAKTDTALWHQILLAHSDIIMGWVVKEPSFFEAVADELTVRTSRGRLTMSEYLQQSSNRIYLVSKQFGSMQAQLLAEGRDVPVIDATWFAVKPFLEQYAQRSSPPLEIIEFDSDVQDLLSPTSDVRYQVFVDEMQRRSIHSQVSKFDPPAVPALMVYPNNAKFLRDTRDALEQNELPDALAGLIGGYLDSRSSETENANGTLHFNANSPLVQDLIQLNPNSEAFRSGCTLLYQLARLLEGEMLNAQQAVGAFQDASRAIQLLLGMQNEKQEREDS
ncbi:ATP-binding protein [Mariniblastus sp.]|nr:ATP-binding protein [Mariniblastus sp.]